MKNFKQFTRDNEPLILEGPMWDDIKARVSSALASAKSGIKSAATGIKNSSALASAKSGIKSAATGIKNYATSGTGWNHAKAVGRGIGDTTVGAIKYTAKGIGGAVGGVVGGAIGGASGHGGGGYNDGRGYDKGKRSGEKEGEAAGLEKGRQESKQAGEAASAANRGHNDTITKFALSKGFDISKPGKSRNQFGIYAHNLRTRPDRVGHDSNGRPFNKKADGSQGKYFGGSTGATKPHTDADWAEHEKSNDALNAAGTASGIRR